MFVLLLDCEKDLLLINRLGRVWSTQAGGLLSNYELELFDSNLVPQKFAAKVPGVKSLGSLESENCEVRNEQF